MFHVWSYFQRFRLRTYPYFFGEIYSWGNVSLFVNYKVALLRLLNHMKLRKHTVDNLLWQCGQHFLAYVAYVLYAFKVRIAHYAYNSPYLHSASQWWRIDIHPVRPPPRAGAQPGCSDPLGSPDRGQRRWRWDWGRPPWGSGCSSPRGTARSWGRWGRRTWGKTWREPEGAEYNTWIVMDSWFSNQHSVYDFWS